MKTKSLLMLAVLAILATVGFTSCDELAVEDNPMQSYITMRTSDVTLKVGDTYLRKAVAAGTAVVVYSSSDETVATVDQEGKVTAIAAGTATITAQTTGYNAEGKKIYLAEEKSYKVTVNDPVNSLSIPATLSVTVGNTATITPTIDPADYPIQWSSSDETIATVDAAGKVTGVAAGAATITAKAGGQTATCAVTVVAGLAYIKYTWNGTALSAPITDYATEYNKVTDSSTNEEWSAGTYVVEGEVTINGSITFNGNVNLIIKDGAKLTVNDDIDGSDKNLSIYGQANQTGQLVVHCSSRDAICGITTLEVHSCQVTATSSGGGCGSFSEIGTFNVYGGSVDGENTSTGYGISSGSMNIYGGDVKAVGKGSDYGIQGDPSTVTVYGGKLWAENADNKAIDFNSITLTKDAGYTSGKIEYSSDKSTWSETVDASATYVRVGY